MTAPVARRSPTPKKRPRRREPIDKAKLAGLAAASAWLAWCWHADSNFGLVGNFILLTHEGGHPLFGIFGRFLGTAGGTLMQLLVPTAFIVNFFFRGQLLSTSVGFHWLAASLFGCSQYAADAIDQDLPLIHTGMSAREELETYGETEHDWINMLDMLHLPLKAAGPIAALFTLAAFAAWAAGLVLGLRAAGCPLPAALERRLPAP